MSMVECPKELIAKERIRQNELNYLTNRVGTYVKRNHDEELATVLQFRTYFVADNVAKEYDAGRNKTDEYSCIEAGGVIKVQGSKHTRDVNRHTWACTCEYALSMLLPCRHAIAARVHLKIKPLIPLERVGLRYVNTLVHILPALSEFLMLAILKMDASAG
jgi:hypothetical protein